MTNTDLAVEVVELVKRYPKRDVNAVDGLSFGVSHGEVFGLLGPNGAGKTTTVGVLTTRVHATSGRAVLAGIDVRRDPVAARSRLAVVPQRSNLDRSLTPRQNLTFHAAYHGVGRTERNERAAALIDALTSVDGVDKAERLRKVAPSFAGGSPGGFPGFGGGGPGAGASMPSPAVATVVPDAKAPVHLRLYLTTDPAGMLGPVV